MRIAALSKVVVIGIAAVAVLAPAGARADDPRPILQMPFPCNEVRQGATYDGHGGSGNHFPLDFNRGTQDDDLGDPVLAAGAGRVRTWVEGDGDTVVRITHNGTWASEVHHLMAGSVTVGDGDQVEQGDRIGRVGKTGTTFAHLHYMQLRNGVPAHLHFDGAPLNPDYSFVFNGPDYKSRNCPTADMSVSGVANADGSLTVFARRSGGMWTKNRRTDGTWGDWANRGGDLASGPDAAVTAAGFYHVVARGANGKVNYRRQGAQGWGDWQLTFSDFDTPFAPAIVALDGNSLLALSVRASDKALMKRRYDAETGWDANWSRAGDGDGWTSGPDASLRDGGRVDVVIRGGGGRVNHLMRTVDGTWTAPQALGDLTTAAGAAPATASRPAGTVDVMARGENGFVHRNIWTADGGWSGWNRVFIGQFNHGPDLVTGTSAGELQLLGRDTDGRIVRSVWNPGQGWTDPTPIPSN
ncbi:MAG TPA: peptidoglycan DD-metalloendopeptidase family protein [Candidatus Limnocylindrales bacterium]